MLQVDQLLQLRLWKNKKIDRAAQFVFQNNFNVPSAPPIVEPVIKANDTSIELIWETYPHTVEYGTSDKYKTKGVGFDMRFEWYEVKCINLMLHLT